MDAVQILEEHRPFVANVVVAMAAMQRNDHRVKIGALCCTVHAPCDVQGSGPSRTDTVRVNIDVNDTTVTMEFQPHELTLAAKNTEYQGHA